MQDCMPAICVNSACGLQEGYFWAMLLNNMDNFPLAPSSQGEVCVYVHMYADGKWWRSTAYNRIAQWNWHIPSAL